VVWKLCRLIYGVIWIDLYVSVSDCETVDTTPIMMPRGKNEARPSCESLKPLVITRLSGCTVYCLPTKSSTCVEASPAFGCSTPSAFCWLVIEVDTAMAGLEISVMLVVLCEMVVMCLISVVFV